MIDGEIVVLDERRHQPLRAAAGRAVGAAPATGSSFFAFDLLHLDGWDLTAAPLARRKALLARPARRRSRRTRRSSSATTSTATARRSSSRPPSCGLEGVVSKRADAPYQPGRSKTWTQDQGAAGRRLRRSPATPRSPPTGGLGALALGEWVDGELVYRGKVGTGFDAATLARRCSRGSSRCAGGEPLDGAPKDIVWVRPIADRARPLLQPAPPTARCATRSSGACARSTLAPAEAGAAQAADLGRRPRRDLGDQPDAAAVRPVRADQARRRGLLRRASATSCCRTSSAGRSPWCAARPGSAQDCFFQRHAFTGMPPTHRALRGRRSPTARTAPTSPSRTPRAISRSRSSAWSSSTPGAAAATRSRSPTASSSTSTPARASPGARWSRRRSTSATSSRRSASSPSSRPPAARACTSSCRSRRRSTWKAVHAGDRRARRARSPRPRPTPSPPSWARRTASGGSSSTSTATPAAPPRSRPIRCGRATICPASAPLTWEDLEAIDAPEDLNYSSLPGLVAASGDPWAEIDEAARNLPAPRRVKG